MAYPFFGMPLKKSEKVLSPELRIDVKSVGFNESDVHNVRNIKTTDRMQEADTVAAVQTELGKTLKLQALYYSTSHLFSLLRVISENYKAL